jgi:neutral ceramidase
MRLLERQHGHLGFTDEGVLLSATHTHCGPGGYSHYILYNVTAGGFVPEVLDAIVRGIAQAIVQAERAAIPAQVRVARGSFPPEVPVAFNRSLEAHNRNQDLARRFTPDERHLAVDREMTLLRFDGLQGEAIGCLNYFPLHPINVHNDQNVIHHDNKGVAAHLLEEALGRRTAAPVVAAFAQGAAGDVTPNFQRFPGLPMLRGVDPDDFKAARANGEMQYELALRLYDEAAAAEPLSPVLDAALAYVDMSRVEVPEDLGGGRTAPAAIGARMLMGTEEGPGIPAVLGDVAHGVARAAATRTRLEALWAGARVHERIFGSHQRHGVKAIAIEAGERRIFGYDDVAALPLPDWVDPAVAHLKDLARRGALGNQPWTPDILPLQILVIGEVAIAALPAEPTTQSGRRLRATVAEALAPRGVTLALVAGYANAYAGYVATPEEYDLQAYEGASTHFGRVTLNAYRAELRKLARSLCLPPAERHHDTGLRPRMFSREELARRLHPGSRL